MTEFYLDERQRKKRRRLLKIKIYLGAAGFLVLIIAVVYLIVWSPLFQIKQIMGSDNIVQELKSFFVSQSKITEFLGVNNILIWDGAKLDKFQKSPGISKITIEKDYWRRNIRITISKREKFGVWCQVDNNCYWFDKNGVLFSDALPSEGNLINKVDDFSGRTLKIGDSALEGRLLSNLIKIFDILEKSNLGTKSLKLERPELQEVSTESLPVIYFSLRNDPGFALSAIESLKLKGLNNLQYIDLRVENRAYYKPR